MPSRSGFGTPPLSIESLTILQLTNLSKLISMNVCAIQTMSLAGTLDQLTSIHGCPMQLVVMSSAIVETKEEQR